MLSYNCICVYICMYMYVSAGLYFYFTLCNLLNLIEVCYSKMFGMFPKEEHA